MPVPSTAGFWLLQISLMIHFLFFMFLSYLSYLYRICWLEHEFKNKCSVMTEWSNNMFFQVFKTVSENCSPFDSLVKRMWWSRSVIHWEWQNHEWSMFAVLILQFFQECVVLWSLLNGGSAAIRLKAHRSTRLHILNPSDQGRKKVSGSYTMYTLHLKNMLRFCRNFNQVL